MTAAARPRLTAIVSAMPEEIAPLVRRAEVERHIRWGDCQAHCGTLGGAPVLLAHTGDGRLRATSGLAQLLEGFPVGRLLVIGIAGGLTPGLEPGTLLLARRVIDGESGPLQPPDPSWMQRFTGGQLVHGAVVSTELILGTPQQKSAARERWLAADEAGAVDLESASYASLAARHGIPYLVLRSISDAAWEGLPLDLNRCRREDGRTSRAKVIGYALLYPAVIPGLWRLRERLRQSAGALAAQVERMLAEERDVVEESRELGPETNRGAEGNE